MCNARATNRLYCLCTAQMYNEPQARFFRYRYGDEYDLTRVATPVVLFSGEVKGGEFGRLGMSGCGGADVATPVCLSMRGWALLPVRGNPTRGRSAEPLLWPSLP